MSHSHEGNGVSPVRVSPVRVDHDPGPVIVNPTDGVVTVWSDIGCPWATLCLDMLHVAAELRKVHLVIDHRAFPLELINRIPTPKGIVDAEVVVIGAHRPALGWKLWTGPADSYPVTMLPALEAVQAAKDPSLGGLRGSDELDTALRAAFYVDNLCISLPTVILDIAATCEHVDHDALASALAAGEGRAQVYAQWHLVGSGIVRGSPHVFASDGYERHNPGVVYHWTGQPPLPLGYGPQGGVGLPKLDSYDESWVDELLNRIASSAAGAIN